MAESPQRLGDYLVFPAFARGGTASVHLGRLIRSGGFHRLVVVKRLQARFAAEPGAGERLLREAKLSSRVRSPYVAATLDVVHRKSDLALIMDFVQGVTLGRLLDLATERNTTLPPRVVVAIVSNVLRGLQAVHEATTEDGQPLELLHRDVAPQNVMVGADGLARVLDFEIAKALGQHGVTVSGEVRGTLGSMAPEQLRGGRPVTRQADIYATGVLLWESLTGKRLREGDAATVLGSLDKKPAPPSSLRADLPKALDALVLRALAIEPTDRYPSADAMAAELEAALAPAPAQEVARTVEKLALDDLDRLREQVRACERYATDNSDDVETASDARAPDEVVGQLIAGKYRVGGVLGRGGMGVVVEAKHIALGESVAIKLLRFDTTTDQDSGERVVREARASLRIKSEHVVRVFDVGTESGEPYLVMEKLDGTDLRSLLAAQGQLAIADAVLYVLQVCEVLAEAHALGIIHRDLKPANLFLTRRTDGSPCMKVLDFGIAKASPADAAAMPSMTDTRAVLGSPAYMSPEQLRSAKHVDERADVWAIGVVLYELLANRHPFAEENRRVPLARIIADPPTPLRKLRPDVPEALAALIDRCLAKDPEERVRTIGEFAIGLEPFGPNDQVSVARIRRLTGNTLPAPAAPRPRRTALLIGLAAAVVAIGAVAVRAATNRDAKAERPQREIPVTAAATETPTSNVSVRSPGTGRSTDTSTGPEGTLVTPTPNVSVRSPGTGRSTDTSTGPEGTLVTPTPTKRPRSPTSPPRTHDASVVPLAATQPAAPVSPPPAASSAPAPAKPPKKVDPSAEFE